MMPKAREPLTAYRSRRDFEKTPEPTSRGHTPRTKKPVFVVQEHHANRLHYDFRLEVDGVLKSWAVPKGPPPDPSVKVLAVETEDHPLEYATFEGTIPEGSYGAGEVSIWDNGTYRNLTERDGHAVPSAEALGMGHLKFRLEGKKLRGAYALTRMQRRKKPQWLLVKSRDETKTRGASGAH
ncbi:MAG: DNA ligase [Actinomycetota bacterium]|nr:DNA ligase [Actinomycetota bacterium]